MERLQVRKVDGLKGYSWRKWLRFVAALLGLGSLFFVGMATVQQISPLAVSDAVAAPLSSVSSRAASRRNEPTPSASSPCPETPAAQGNKGRLILNLATAEQLTGLPGIGRKRAMAIVQLRKRLGRFRRRRDLLRIRGFGWRLLKRIRPLVDVDPAPKKRKKRPKGATRRTAGS